MMARQCCRLGEVHNQTHGCWKIDKNDRQMTVSIRAGLKGRLMDNPG